MLPHRQGLVAHPLSHHSNTSTANPARSQCSLCFIARVSNDPCACTRALSLSLTLTQSQAQQSLTRAPAPIAPTFEGSNSNPNPSAKAMLSHCCGRSRPNASPNPFKPALRRVCFGEALSGAVCESVAIAHFSSLCEQTLPKQMLPSARPPKACVTCATDSLQRRCIRHKILVCLHVAWQLSVFVI